MQLALSRRLLLHACVVGPFGSRLLSSPAHAIGELGDRPPEVAMSKVQEGRAQYTVPGVWLRPAPPAAGVGPSPWMDSMNGPVADTIGVTATPTALSSLDALGEISRVPLTKLGFDDLAKADLVAAVRRQVDKDSPPYFDYDLAISPATCARDQEIVMGSCLPTRVVLLSCTVLDGKLHVLRINASPAQWRKAGTTLRDVRKSFVVS